MHQWRNWQTRTFEGRVIYSYGFKSRLVHQIYPHTKSFRALLFCLLLAGYTI
jgi:hypothetical protein